MYHYNQGDTSAEGEEQKFELTEDGMMVFNFSSRKDKFWININPDDQMYLNYFAVYDGTWSASDLGLAASRKLGATRGTTETIFDTETNSITLTDLNTDSRYVYCIRSLGDAGSYSKWSEEKSFAFSSSGITNLIFQNNADANRVYDLNGRYVGTNLDALPKGVYILNKKKILK